MFVRVKQWNRTCPWKYLLLSKMHLQIFKFVYYIPYHPKENWADDNHSNLKPWQYIKRSSFIPCSFRSNSQVRDRRYKFEVAPKEGWALPKLKKGPHWSIMIPLEKKLPSCNNLTPREDYKEHVHTFSEICTWNVDIKFYYFHCLFLVLLFFFT